MTTSDTSVDTFNGLLRGELAATETYQQALEKVGTEPEGEPLRRIHAEHREAANTIRQHIHHLGGQPDQDSGAWGAFAKAVAGGAKLFGNAAALKALKEGEEKGANDYQAALQNDHLGPTCRNIVTNLLAQTRAHISVLDRTLGAR